MSKQGLSEEEMSRPRRLVFKLITWSVPLLIILLIEGGLRLVSYGENLNLFIKNPTEGYEEYMMVNPNIGDKYFQKFESSPPPNDIFLKKKPEGTFRIFVMGSSTVVGFPYGKNLMFSRILHKRLQDSYPGKKIEVVNTAITAINSYTLLDYRNEILKYKPDAILIYAGHNEFYGAFGIGSNESMSKSRFLTKLHFRCMDLRVYQLIRNLTSSAARRIASLKAPDGGGTLMRRIVSDKEILFDGEDYSLTMKHYKQNMEDLVGKFRSRDIPVFYSDLISNVKDIPPFNSVETATLESARIVYNKGVEAYKSGDYESARELFYRAKDLDCVRFRASEDVNHIIREIIAEYDTYYVPMLHLFQSNSPYSIIGNNLVTEHVHPNIRGIFLMADGFYTEIVKSGILGNISVGPLYSSDYYKRNWGFTELDSLIGHHRVTNLMNYWPFVSADAKIPDYRVVYHPKSTADSLAFDAFRDTNLLLGDLRLELAKKYESKGDYFDAYREYEAVLRTNPYVAINYRDAASALIYMAHLPQALHYFIESLRYENSDYAHYRLGEIYLLKGDYENAVKSFETAFSLATDNIDRVKVMGKLYSACIYGNYRSKAQAIAQQLKQFGAEQYLRIPPKSYLYDKYIPLKTREMLSEAMELAGHEKYMEALTLLDKSLNIYDSHIAHRYMGEIYIQLRDAEKALYHLSLVFEEFRFDPKFLGNLAYLNIAIRNFDQAERLLLQLKGLEPNYNSIPALEGMLIQAKKTG